MLLAIKKYIQCRKEVTLFELATYFSLPVDVMKARLEHWVAKGVIIQTPLSHSCSSCSASKCGHCSQVKNIANDSVYTYVASDQTIVVTHC